MKKSEFVVKNQALAYASSSQAVDHRCLEDGMPGAAQGIVALVVREKEKNIGLATFLGLEGSRFARIDHL